MGFRWGKNRNSGAVGMYDPNRYDGEGTTVFSAFDITRAKILEMTFSMNDTVTKYLQYKKAGKLPPYIREEAQKTIQELFSFIRESLFVWLQERRDAIRKLENAKKPRVEYIKEQLKDYQADLDTAKNLDILDGGRDATDDFMITCKRLLNKYVYFRGISKLEVDNRDPIEDFSKQAYGQDYSKEDENENPVE